MVLALMVLVGSGCCGPPPRSRSAPARRRRHRAMVDVLAIPDGLVPGLRVLTEQTPLA